MEQIVGTSTACKCDSKIDSQEKMTLSLSLPFFDSENSKLSTDLDAESGTLRAALE